MRAARAVVLGLLLTFMAPFAYGQEEPAQEEAHEMPTPPPAPEDALMDARIGTWQGTGTMMGMPVTETMTASWVLGHHFVVFESEMTMTTPDGQEVPMEMHMITKVNGDGTYAGMYLDSWGIMGDYTARIDEEGNLVTEWTDPTNGNLHRSVDAANADGGWTMRFYTQQPDGTWAESGSMTYTRAAG